MQSWIAKHRLCIVGWLLDTSHLTPSENPPTFGDCKLSLKVDRRNAAGHRSVPRSVSVIFMKSFRLQLCCWRSPDNTSFGVLSGVFLSSQFVHIPS